MQATSLYHIRREHLDILAQIEEQDGELADHQEYALQLTEEAFQEKAVSVGFITKFLANDVTLIDAEIKRLQALKAATARRQEWFEDQLAGAMRQFGVEKIDTPTLKISFRKSLAVEVEDEAKLPACYVVTKTTTAPDKKAIKEAIQKGQEVPGASLTERQNLQIK